jgi:glycosyltransferase involved in cell wall biosynthesis
MPNGELMRRLEITESFASATLQQHRSEPSLLSFVVPAFNEADGLEPFLIELHGSALKLCPRVQLILVDDGSDDETPAIAARLVRSLGLHYVRLSRNFGKEAALSAGIDRAEGDAVVLIDADYQHPLELISDMLDHWRRGYDVVYGIRRDRAQENLLKRMGTRLLYKILSADASVTIPAAAGDFRLLDRRVVHALRRLHERNRFMKGLYAWVGFSSIALPFDVCTRRHGASRFPPRKLLRLALDGITAFTNLPLRIWSGFGIVMSLSALAYGAWVVVQTLIEGNEVPGWTTIVAGLMFFSGVQLISIGIVGEYLGRVFDEVKGRPIYIVREETVLSRPATEDGAPAAGDAGNPGLPHPT